MTDDDENSPIARNPFEALIKLLANVPAALGPIYRSIAKLDIDSPYPLLTPTTDDEIEDAVEASYENSGQKLEQDRGGDIARRASAIGYQFIDRGVSRAQGLLAFNSIVFASVSLAKVDNLNVVGRCILVGALVLLVTSTLLSLLSTLVIWFHPENHRDKKAEAKLVWKTWIHRSLMFNVSVYLSAFSFLLLSGLAIFEIMFLHVPANQCVSQKIWIH